MVYIMQHTEKREFEIELVKKESENGLYYVLDVNTKNVNLNIFLDDASLKALKKEVNKKL